MLWHSGTYYYGLPVMKRDCAYGNTIAHIMG